MPFLNSLNHVLVLLSCHISYWPRAYIFPFSYKYYQIILNDNEISLIDYLITIEIFIWIIKKQEMFQ